MFWFCILCVCRICRWEGSRLLRREWFELECKWRIVPIAPVPPQSYALLLSTNFIHVCNFFKNRMQNSAPEGFFFHIHVLQFICCAYGFRSDWCLTEHLMCTFQFSTNNVQFIIKLWRQSPTVGICTVELWQRYGLCPMPMHNITLCHYEYILRTKWDENKMTNMFSLRKNEKKK